MTATVLSDPSVWWPARVIAKWLETDRAATLRLEVDQWPGHVAGQRVDVRLTAEDGYQATRSYSIASAPSDGTLDLTVERIDEGEVSPYLVDEAQIGDELEVRGPIGGWFTWEPAAGGPLVLLGGGSGIVPLMAMAREAIAQEALVDIRLLASTRARADLLFAGELRWLSDRGTLRLEHTITRERPADWTGRTGRIAAPIIADLLIDLEPPRAAYICGPSGFVDRAAALLVEARTPPEAIRTERFGPST